MVFDEIYSTVIKISHQSGIQFVPKHVVEIFHIKNVSSLCECISMCYLDSRCRTFDYAQSSSRCRLLDGDFSTGTIERSSADDSLIGFIYMKPEFFAAFNKSCEACVGSRYLQCINGKCQCPINTFFNGSICQSAVYYGAECSLELNMCRADINLTCLPFFQCGPAEILAGTTVAGYGNGASGSSAIGLNKVRGIYVSTLDETLYVCDAFNYRIQRFKFGNRVGVTVAGNTGHFDCTSSVIKEAWNIFVDNVQNLYIADLNCNRVIRWTPNATNGTVIATGSGISDVAFDQYGNFYIPLYYMHVILQNGNKIVAGHYNVSGNTSTYLNSPRDIFYDENTSSLFVCDTFNHRIQQFKMNSSDGITVAGGNGNGSAPDQLNEPFSVWVSSKTGYIYIADTKNHRIQRWKMNDTKGVTILGNGTPGILPTMLNAPVGVALNANETYIYVSEQNNHRVQRFKLLV